MPRVTNPCTCAIHYAVCWLARAGFTVRGVWCGYSAVVSADARPAPVVLGSWPTPLEPAPRLAAAVGLAADALWVKRDDLTGLGGGGNKVRQDGGIPHVIPHGGSNSYAAQAYVDCSGELLAQLPGLDHVIVAFGSGATMAGLVAGLGAERVIGIDAGAVADSSGRLDELLDGMPDMRVRRADLQLDDGQDGAGYAAVTPAAREAMRLAARTEGIFLDPTYTARALAGLIARVADGSIKREDRTVFMHTGGLPGLFGHPELPCLTVP